MNIEGPGRGAFVGCNRNDRGEGPDEGNDEPIKSDLTILVRILLYLVQ